MLRACQWIVDAVFGLSVLFVAVSPAPISISPALDADATLPTVLKGPVGQNFDWSGWYVGSHLGYAVGSSNWSALLLGVAAPALTGSLDLFNTFDAFKGTGSYLAGLQAGYNFMFPSRLVLGIEADASFPNTIGRTATFSSASSGVAS